jgi:hypothetical protein
VPVYSAIAVLWLPENAIKLTAAPLFQSIRVSPGRAPSGFQRIRIVLMFQGFYGTPFTKKSCKIKARRRTLTPLILVRIQEPGQLKFHCLFNNLAKSAQSWPSPGFSALARENSPPRLESHARLVRPSGSVVEIVTSRVAERQAGTVKSDAQKEIAIRGAIL